MIMQQIKKEYIYILAATLFIFYCYNTTFQAVFFGSRMIGVLMICIVALLCFVKSIRIKSDKRVTKILFWWLCFALFSIVNNQDMMNDSESRWLLPMAGIVVLLSLSKEKVWVRNYISLSKFFVLLHAFFTIFFFFFKKLYLNLFINFIPGDHSYLIAKFNTGCMPGITGHYSTNGIYLGFGLLYFAVNFVTKKYSSGKRLLFDAAQCFMVLFALVLTTKRAHILFGFLAILVMYYVYNSNKKISRCVYIIASICALFVFVLATYQFIPAIGNVVNRFLKADGGELTNGRIWFWEFALRKFRSSPVFGIGWGGFKHEYYKVIGPYASTSKWVDCHCVFLQVLCEQGIVGEILFLLSLFGSLKITWEYLKKGRVIKNYLTKYQEKVLTLSLGIQTFFILYCVTGNCLYDCEAFFPYVLAVAASLGTISEVRKEKSKWLKLEY